jgi:hypothetical protein
MSILLADNRDMPPKQKTIFSAAKSAIGMLKALQNRADLSAADRVPIAVIRPKNPS